MSYQRLKWITFTVAAAALVALQFIFFDFSDFVLGPMPQVSRIILRSAAVIAGVYIFNLYVFYLIERVHVDLERERERTAALHQASQGLASLVGLERNLTPTLEVVRRVLQADTVAWVERDERGAEAACRLVVGDQSVSAVKPLRVRLGQGLAGRALSTERTVFLEDLATLAPEHRSSYHIMEALGLRAAVATPAVSSHSSLGVVLAGWRQPRRIAVADRSFLENVGNQMGVAVDNWRLYREIQRVGALEERDRLAREMHDGLAQTLTYLKLKAESALQQASSGHWDAVSTAVESIRLAAVESLGDVRQSIVDLRAAGGGSGRDTGSFLSNLAEYLHTWSKLNDIEVELVAAEDDVQLSDEETIHVMRIIQEALANVRKHAAAHRATVRVGDEGQAFTASVCDDGQGFVPGSAVRTGHFGLALMRERAASIGATLEFTSEPGRGTEVVLRLPPHRSGEWLPPTVDRARSAGA